MVAIGLYHKMLADGLVPTSDEVVWTVFLVSDREIIIGL